MDNDEILIKKEFVNRLKAYLNEIEFICEDNTEIKRKVQDLGKYIDNNFTDKKSEKEKLEELIYVKMQDSKRSDKDLYAKLYMLYQDVKNDRIDMDRAKELSESFVRYAQYDKRIF